MKINVFVASIVFGIASVAAVPTAWAQYALAEPSGNASGTITARSYNTLPPGAAIAVQPADDTDQSQRIKSAIERALQKSGYRVSDDAPLVLEFYSSEVLGPGAPNTSACRRPDGGWVQSPVPCTSQFPSPTPLAQLNQSLFGSPDHSSDKPSSASLPQVHLSIMLDNRQVRKRVWQGSASADLAQGDTFAATAALVPFLMAKLGQTIGVERFDVPIAMR